MNLRRRQALTLPFFLLIAIGIRIFFLFLQAEADLSYRDYSILQEQTGEFSLAQIFTGSDGFFTSSLAAFISFLRGPSIVNTRLSSLIFFSLFLLSAYFTGKEVSGSKVGILCILLITCGSPFFILSNVSSHGGMMDILFLGNILLLLGIRLRKGVNHSLLLAGIVAGLGILAGRASFSFYVFGFFLIVCRKFSLRDILLFISGLLPGSSLLTIYILCSRILPSGAIIKLSPPEAIASLTGFSSFEGYYGYILIIIYAILLLVAVSNFRYGSSSESFYIGRLFLLFLIVLTVSCILKSEWRYELAVFSVFPVLVSYGLVKMRRKLFYPLIFIIVSINMRSMVLSYQYRKVPAHVSENTEEYGLGRLIDFLKGNDIKACYAIPSLGFRVMSGTMGGVISSLPWHGVRVKRTQFVDASDRFAYVVKGSRDRDKFMNSLLLVGENYKMEDLHPVLTVFYDFSPPDRGLEVKREGWVLSSSHNTELLSNSIDAVSSTRWSTGRPQRPGMFFLVDLGRFYKINGISLLSSREEDCPKYFTIFSSTDGSVWREIISVETAYFPGLHWSGSHLFWEKRTGNVDINFPVIEARYIKIVLKGFSRNFHWSIDELFVYEAIDDREYLSQEEIGELYLELLRKKFRQVYGPEWLMAKLSMLSGGKLLTLWRYDKENVYNELPGNLKLNEKTVFVIEMDKSAEFERLENLEKLGNFSGYCLYGLKKSGERLPAAGWKAVSNYRSREASLAFDGRADTRWSTGRPQERGDYFELDTGSVSEVSEVSLTLEGSVYDYPRGLKLFASTDGISWKELAVKSDYRYHYTFDGRHLLKANQNPSEVRFRFKPARLRFLRAVLTEADDTYYWSIHEIHLYR